MALLERLDREEPAGTTSGLLDELHRQPHLGASVDAFTGAKAHARRAASHARELFRVADGWVAVRLGEAFERGRFKDAIALFRRLVLSKELEPFLTVPAYQLIA